MEKAKKNLRIWSILYLVLAFIDSLNLVFAAIAGNFNTSSVPENYRMAVLVIILGIAVLLILIKLFLGIQGTRQVEGQYKGYSHITLATVISVVLSILVIFDLATIATKASGVTVSNLCSDLLSLVIIYDYKKQATVLLEKKK